MSPSSIKCLSRLLLVASTAFGSHLANAKIVPSDCRPRDADSTCATAVRGATVVTLPAFPDGVLYDGPLGGVPASGWAYWGFDFFADRFGTSSPVRNDEFINRSNVPVTITLTFNFPTDHSCDRDCLPGMHFQADAGWHRLYPPFVLDGDKVTMTSSFRPGQGYGWAVELWQSSNPRLTVSVPKGSTASLESVGLAPLPAIATEIPRVMSTCDCQDGTAAPCSDGSHFSNGLLGSWIEADDMYQRAGAFGCPINH